MVKLNALFAEAGDGDGTGSGAPGEGSSKDGQDNKSKDGEFVPKTQLIAALHSAEQKYESQLAAVRSEFEGKLEAATVKKTADPPQRWSRAELNAAVADSRITQEQADAQYEAQIREDAQAVAQRVALNVVTSEQRKGHVETEISRYKAAAPEIMDDSHETRQKIKDEFSYLVQLGDNPRSLETQLKAIRAVIGPVDKIERARAGKTAGESHRETGGGGGGDRGVKKTDKFSEALSPKEKDYYEDMIRKGHYKDWKDVEAMFSQTKNRTRRGQRATA